MVPVSVMSASSQSSCHRAASARLRCWSRWCSSSGNIASHSAASWLPASRVNGRGFCRSRAETGSEDVAAAVVGGEHRGQHQAPGQQGDGAAGSAGDMAGGIDIVLSHRENV